MVVALFHADRVANDLYSSIWDGKTGHVLQRKIQ